jgi:DNA-binding MarR family transcriptional regulator
MGYDAPVSGVDRVWPWAALLRVHAAVVPRVERALAKERMPLAWYDVLLELNSAPDRRLRMTDLSARVVLSRERVSRVVDELEDAGLVRRERNVEDKRSFLAAITPDGRARLRAAAPVYLAGIEEHYASHLTDDEIRVIGQAFARVLQAEEPARTSDGSSGRGSARGRPRASPHRQRDN